MNPAGHQDCFGPRANLQPTRRLGTYRSKVQLSESGSLHRFVAFLPNWPKALKTLKPLPYARDPQTLGEHLKRRRYQLGLRQKDVAASLNINVWTYLLWENDETKPSINRWPGIIRFLGYDPYPDPTTLGERLFTHRRQQGLSRKKLAIILGADEHTIWQWEIDKKVPTEKRHLTALAELKLGSKFTHRD